MAITIELLFFYLLLSSIILLYTSPVMTIDRISLLPPTDNSLFFYVCEDLLTLEIDGDRTRL
jgi:hypothetical protein